MLVSPLSWTLQGVPNLATPRVMFGRTLQAPTMPRPSLLEWRQLASTLLSSAINRGCDGGGCVSSVVIVVLVPLKRETTVTNAVLVGVTVLFI